MPRVEFKLTMPGRASWDGKWSGDGKHYALLRELDAASAASLDGRSWSYRWPDGWRAEIVARIVREGETIEPSRGFLGYDWMVTSLLRDGKILADHERSEADLKAAQTRQECDPVGACASHGRCWTHSEWQRCGARSEANQPCEAVVDGPDGMCSDCRSASAAMTSGIGT